MKGKVVTPMPVSIMRKRPKARRFQDKYAPTSRVVTAAQFIKSLSSLDALREKERVEREAAAAKAAAMPEHDEPEVREEGRDRDREPIRGGHVPTSLHERQMQEKRERPGTTSTSRSTNSGVRSRPTSSGSGSSSVYSHVRTQRSMSLSGRPGYGLTGSRGSHGSDAKDSRPVYGSRGLISERDRPSVLASSMSVRSSHSSIHSHKAPLSASMGADRRGSDREGRSGDPLVANVALTQLGRVGQNSMRRQGQQAKSQRVTSRYRPPTPPRRSTASSQGSGSSGYGSQSGYGQSKSSKPLSASGTSWSMHNSDQKAAQQGTWSSQRQGLYSYTRPRSAPRAASSGSSVARSSDGTSYKSATGPSNSRPHSAPRASGHGPKAHSGPPYQSHSSGSGSASARRVQNALYAAPASSGLAAQYRRPASMASSLRPRSSGSTRSTYQPPTSYTQYTSSSGKR
ncbi:hypothetical protein KIPB_002237 [Kipferlia bialata]|uniref:Uncharacterized protein n=1 Tax=Kipferlia bialata TaxID=797122 RepID=A0A391NPK4_9EUKA|nr:hypothetical protein KIPB_002237 [Kipferlia bialata]|eukprot:g2237.t1